MPFSPLPATLVDDLTRLVGLTSPVGLASPVGLTSPVECGEGPVAHLPALELGSGDGLLTEQIRALGVAPITLDRRSAVAGAQAMVRGDACHPPFGRRFAIVVAGNLLRHLWPAFADVGPIAWRELVAPGGCLWILEDQPLTDPASARHYRDLQAMLARLDPQGRGGLLSQRGFQAARRAWGWRGTWRDGRQKNDWPLEPQQIIDWLAAGDPEPGGEVANLLDGIRADGIDYGQFWWARWQADSE